MGNSIRARDQGAAFGFRSQTSDFGPRTSATGTWATWMSLCRLCFPSQKSES